jgi:hypothetical protein
MLKPALFSSDKFVWLRKVRAYLAPHKSVLVLAAGIGLGWSAMHCTVVVPLRGDLRSMQGNVAAMTERMDRLVARADAAHSSSDLLSALEAQAQSMTGARESLATLRQLRSDVEQEGRHAIATRESLAELDRLQQQVLAATARLDALRDSLAAVDGVSGQAENLQAVVVKNRDAMSEAEAAIANLGRLKESVLQTGSDLVAAEELVAATARLEASMTALAPLLPSAQERANSLTQIVTTLEGTTAEEAQIAETHATKLLALQDLLADAEGLRLPEAQRNLQSLMSTHADLLRTTPELAAAAENLELLRLFQQELGRELTTLQQLRHDLTEVTLLKDTVERLNVALAPLAEMSNLQRLDADQVREVAREILQRRTAQLPAGMSVPGTIIPATDIGESLPVDQGRDIVVPEPQLAD